MHETLAAAAAVAVALAAAIAFNVSLRLTLFTTFSPTLLSTCLAKFHLVDVLQDCTSIRQRNPKSQVARPTLATGRVAGGMNS